MDNDHTLYHDSSDDAVPVSYTEAWRRDMESEEEEPERDDPSAAWERVDIVTDGDGQGCTAYVETNDDNDDGYNDGHVESWERHFKTVKEALHRYGHGQSEWFGISGVHCTVTVDGESVEQYLTERPEDRP